MSFFRIFSRKITNVLMTFYKKHTLLMSVFSPKCSWQMVFNQILLFYRTWISILLLFLRVNPHFFVYYVVQKHSVFEKNYQCFDDFLQKTHLTHVRFFTKMFLAARCFLTKFCFFLELFKDFDIIAIPANKPALFSYLTRNAPFFTLTSVSAFNGAVADS